MPAGPLQEHTVHRLCVLPRAHTNTRTHTEEEVPVATKHTITAKWFVHVKTKLPLSGEIRESIKRGQRSSCAGYRRLELDSTSPDKPSQLHVDSESKTPHRITVVLRVVDVKITETTHGRLIQMRAINHNYKMQLHRWVILDRQR